MARGRPTKYNQELADSICEEIATSSKGLASICKPLGISLTSVFQWLVDYKEFADKYACAKEAQAEFMADEMIEIADKCRLGKKTIHKPTGTEVTEGDMVDRSRLMIDTRKWLASKLKPKKYGDKMDLTSDGEKLQAPVINILPPSE